ncbi:MAG: hypothetical protein COA94_02145 [Rickettsiales bacterium]|nr:MAG: hypothetical protein COA94_02145 [Rickettsiales bacterium]
MNFSKEEILVVTEATKTLVVPKGIKKVVCSEIGLETLILNEEVEYVDCSYNKITKLLVTNNVARLYCHDNKLTELTIPHSVARLYCHDNLFEDLSKYSEVIKPKVVSLYAMCHEIVKEKNVPECFDGVNKVTCDECEDKVIKDLVYVSYRGHRDGYIRKTIQCKKCF